MKKATAIDLEVLKKGKRREKNKRGETVDLSDDCA